MFFENNYYFYGCFVDNKMIWIQIRHKQSAGNYILCKCKT